MYVLCVTVSGNIRMDKAPSLPALKWLLCAVSDNGNGHF